MALLKTVCGACGNPMEIAPSGPEARAACPKCSRIAEAIVFPRFLRPAEGAKPHAAEEGAANCFNHPDKQASCVCDYCGRFICNLCEIDIEARKSCPGCLEGGLRTNKFQDLERERTRWDVIAFNMALLAIPFFFISFLITPTAIYLAIRHWNSPLSILTRSRWRFVAALILGVLEIGGWGVFLAFMLKA